MMPDANCLGFDWIAVVYSLGVVEEVGAVVALESSAVDCFLFYPWLIPLLFVLDHK